MKKQIVLLLLCFSRFAFASDVWDAEAYYQHSSVQRMIAEELLLKIPFKGDERLLDIGCGDGKITASIAEKVPSGIILGIDLSPVMIGFAQKNYGSCLNATFHIQDAHDLDFEEAFDGIVSFTALQWIKRHDVLVKGMWKGLKQGGRFGITMPMGLPTMLQRAVDEITTSEKWCHYFEKFATGWNFVDAEGYRELLEQTGFQIDHFQVVRHNEVFASKVDFNLFLSQFFPYIRPLPSELKPLFMHEVIERFIELEPLDEEHQLHFVFNRLDVVGHK